LFTQSTRQIVKKREEVGPQLLFWFSSRSSLLSLWLTDWIELWVDWETASINASIRKLRNKFRPFSSSLKKWERPSAGWARCCDGDLVFAVGLPMSKKENGPGGRRYRQTDWNRCRTDSFRRTPSTTSKMSTILSTLTRPPSHFPFNSDRLSTPKMSIHLRQLKTFCLYWRQKVFDNPIKHTGRNDRANDATKTVIRRPTHKQKRNEERKKK
jgi:hypothetical protein